MRTIELRSHSPYGACLAILSLRSSSETMRCSAVSTRKMRPGGSLPFCRTFSGGMSRTPTSEDITTRSSLVT